MNDVAVIRCRGRIVLGAEADLLQSELDERTQLRKKVLLNLAETDYLDSFGLGLLVRALRVLKANGGELKLCEPHPSVLNVLRITNLLTVFATYATEREAIEAFSGGRRSDQTPAESSGSKILCVDTSPDVLAYLSALLKRAGYETPRRSTWGGSDAGERDCRTLWFAAREFRDSLRVRRRWKVFRESVPGIRIVNLPADFSIAEAGQAGVDHEPPAVAAYHLTAARIRKTGTAREFRCPCDNSGLYPFLPRPQIFH